MTQTLQVQYLSYRGWNGFRQSVKPQVEADWTRVRLPTAPRRERTNMPAYKYQCVDCNEIEVMKFALNEVHVAPLCPEV